jgi:hypothetical protein
VLKLLAVFCENVNIEFQRFLVVQTENEQYSSNTNLVNEVANFLSFFLEVDDRQLQLIQRSEVIC